MPELLLALDAGTTSARALLIDAAGEVLGFDKRQIPSHFPAPGRVEQDGELVWQTCRQAMTGALTAAGRTLADVAAVGVTTQRSSVVLWDRATGRPVAPILVWSDLRGMDRYRELRAAGFPSWPQVPSAKLPDAIALAPDGAARAAAGELCWGTLDSYLVYRLSGGSAHVTDGSCGWMTGYLDYATVAGWNSALLEHQHLPERVFPRLVDSWGAIAVTAPAVMGAAVPITALIADQQAGMVAHDRLGRGDWKVSYGTSAVAMVATGDAPMSPHASMPAELLAKADGTMRFCIEGMVISAGSFIDWMCGTLGLFASPSAMAVAAQSVADSKGVRVRPSLAGLGTPHGRFAARGVIAGLSFDATPAHIARASFEGIAFRIREIADAIAAVPGLDVQRALPVDGGLSASDLFLQLQADTLGRTVRRHRVREATAYGAALAAGLGAGSFKLDDLSSLAGYDRSFEPAIGRDQADAEFAAWSVLTSSEA